MSNTRLAQRISLALACASLMATLTACGASAPPAQTPAPNGPPAIGDIVVENRKIDAPSAYMDEDGVVMAPVQAVAEALGYTVTYDASTRTMTLNDQITLTVGGRDCAASDGSIVTLETPPELENGAVYAPLAFFREVLGMNNAYLLEGQVVIDNQEKME